VRLTRSAAGRRRSSAAVVSRRADENPVWTRIALGGLAIAVLLAIFGLPPVDLHGPLHYLGVMDPLCGGTRSVYLTLHGHLREALHYNPAGPMLVVAALAVLIRAAVGRLTSYWVRVRPPRRLSIAVGVVALVALEVNQQLHVALLTQPWGGS
jgi:hypothetical protein